MARDCVLPELGENITTATVVDVFIKVGDVVKADQAVLSLETDKAEFELPAPAAGKVTEVLVGAGDDVTVGQLLFRLAGAGDQPAKPGAEPEAAPAPETEPQPEAASEPDAVPDALAAVPAGSTESVSEESAPLGTRGTGSRATVVAPTSAAGTEPAGDAPRPEAVQSGKPIVAAPSVRRLARALGVDLAHVKAGSADGRLTAQAVEGHVRDLLSGRTASAADPALEAPDFSRQGPVDTEPMSKVRRRTAEQMASAWAQIPHVTHHDLADISELDRLRQQYAPRVEKAGAKLTVTAVLLKVLASALKRFPKLNASVDMATSTIVYKRYVNLGVAVDTEKGLLVPVVHGADGKNIVELALTLHDVSERARKRNITPDLLQGATFTITNLGGIGGTAFSPLINPPEVAVLGVSSARRQPVWTGEAFEPRLMLPLSVSYDHRVIDGADAARFLRWVCEALEEPFVMDLEGD
jgi:pyruvate dehydrogenase E2 component (dihydrolipoamide acetyltransferase)